MATVEAYISLNTPFDTQQAAEGYISETLGFPEDSYVAEAPVELETALGATLDTLDEEWFGPDMQVVVYTLRTVTERIVTEEVEVGWELVDVTYPDEDGDMEPEVYQEQRPVYETRERVVEEVTLERRAFSYERETNA